MEIDKSDVYEINWVTDPYDPIYSNENQNILNSLKDTKILYIKAKDLNNGVISYKYKFSTSNYILLNNIYNSLAKVSFSPLIFPLNVTNDFYIPLRLEIIKVLVRKYLLIDVKYFSFFYYKGVKIVQPNDKTALYRNPKFYEKILNIYLSLPEYMYYITDNAEKIDNFNKKFTEVAKDIIVIDNLYFIKYYEPYIQLLNNNL